MKCRLRYVRGDKTIAYATNLGQYWVFRSKDEVPFLDLDVVWKFAIERIPLDLLKDPDIFLFELENGALIPYWALG